METDHQQVPNGKSKMGSEYDVLNDEDGDLVQSVP